MNFRKIEDRIKRSLIKAVTWPFAGLLFLEVCAGVTGEFTGLLLGPLCLLLLKRLFFFAFKISPVGRK